MDLTQALQQSRYVETTINGTNIIIERFSGPDNVSQCWQYDMHCAEEGRYHKTIYGDIDELFACIYEDGWLILEDGQLEQANWQPSFITAIDITDCTCHECFRFCLECQMIPVGMAWHLAMRYRVTWAVEGVLWRVRWNWMRLQEKYGYWR